MKYALIGCGRIAINHILAALDNNLEILPVINKIDLPNARPEMVIEEIEND